MGKNDGYTKIDSVESAPIDVTGEKVTKSPQQIINRIIEAINRGGGVGQKYERLTDAFFELPSSTEEEKKNKEDNFRRFPEDLKLKILANNISRFKKEEAELFLRCVSHTQTYKIFNVAGRGFGKVETEKKYEDMTEDEKKEYEKEKREYAKKEYDYWFKLSPEERMIIYPFLKNKPSRAGFAAKGLAYSVPVGVLYSVELAWRGAAKFFGIGGTFAFPLCEALSDIANRIGGQIENRYDYGTWKKIGKISEFVDENTKVDNVLGKNETQKENAKKTTAEKSPEEIFLDLTKPGRSEDKADKAKTDLKKLATLFSVLTAEEQVKYFSVLEKNHKAQFFLLGKGVIKDEAVTQCCGLVDYDATAAIASKNFKKVNITTSDSEKNIIREGKKVFDLHKIPKDERPSATWEVAKGIFKIIGMVAAIAACVSWLTTLGLGMAAVGAVFGLSVAATKIIGFSASCVLTAAITKACGKFKLVETWNPMDNFRKAKLISDAKRVEEVVEKVVESRGGEGKLVNESDINSFKQGLYGKMNERDKNTSQNQVNQEGLDQDNVKNQNANGKSKLRCGKDLHDLSITAPPQSPTVLDEQEINN